MMIVVVANFNKDCFVIILHLLYYKDFIYLKFSKIIYYNMSDIKKELVAFRNIVDDTLYGVKQISEVNKRKFMLDKASLGSAVAYSTRNKIYNDILDIIYLMRKGEFPVERTILLTKRINIHLNQLKKLEPSTYEKNKCGLDTLINWIKLTQIKQQSIKNPTKIYSKLIN